jgi:hypothetical protein
MSIKIGDKIRYVATSEDGEVVDVSKVSPGCVLVRFGESFECPSSEIFRQEAS